MRLIFGMKTAPDTAVNQQGPRPLPNQPIKGKLKMKKHIKDFRIETKAGRIVGHAWHIEQAEMIAHKGHGRWIFKWIDNQ